MYDKDIREPLFDFLDEKYGKNRIFEEKTMGRSRADIIMIVENEIIGLEIKSDADTYDRLKRQARDYNKFCDRNYIVIGKSHLKHVKEHIAKAWGIICVQEDGESIEITEIRPADINPKCKLEHQMKWMWRPELRRIQEKNKLPKYREKSKQFVQDKLLERVEHTLLKRQMIEELFERDYTLWDEEMERFRSEVQKKR